MNHSDGGGADMDDLSDDPSSPESDNFDDSDLLSGEVHDEVTAQLAAAGPVGVAAAAAIATAKKRKRPHTFETNPSIRKRQQTRLLRKLKQTIDEYTTRVGQQAVVLIVTPGKPQNNFKVFGARPLESVVRQCRPLVMQELEAALAQHAPPQVKEDPTLHELPPLVVDGIPTPVEKMTQAQLRAFIPLMLKYSTGRGKPGWGKDSTRPQWWPADLPWANVRSDARNEEDKQKQVSWTHALRQIVINCYKYHGREDLLPAFSEEEDKSTTSTATMYTQPLSHFTPMVQTINNPDGTLSIIQVDPQAVVAISDGQNQMSTLRTLRFQSNDGGQGGVQTLAEIATGQDQEQRIAQISTVNVDIEGGGTQAVSLAEATIGPDGQIILTGEDGTQSSFPMSGMVTIPVSMYQQVVSNLNINDSQSIPLGLSTLAAANSNQLGDSANDDDNEVKCEISQLNGQASIRLATAGENNS
ncbi:PREDICTED: DNA-binding protein P3A2-like [Rhagoletis zephyria]|uniref:DNA-binding protein P3A2-like n=1 Tax=Rhagoletis zephyria TaxID=28612 RepID=UPI000811216B|nr:PREDICTED: DNA-binding protein P3A2-like [Rhagoletis zephyria]